MGLEDYLVEDMTEEKTETADITTVDVQEDESATAGVPAVAKTDSGAPAPADKGFLNEDGSLNLKKAYEELKSNNCAFTHEPLKSVLENYCEKCGKAESVRLLDPYYRFDATGLYGAEILRRLLGDNLRYSENSDSFFLWENKEGVYHRYENREVLIHDITKTMVIVEHSACQYVLTGGRRKVLEMQAQRVSDKNIKDYEKALNGIISRSKQFATVSMAKEILIQYLGMWKRNELPEYYDSPYINMSNGVLNLETRVLLPHSPEYKQTKISGTAYLEGADCPEFKAMMERLLPNADTRKELQKAFGLCLAKEQLPAKKVLNLLVGPKDTGKTTVLNTILAVLQEGQYGKTVDNSLLMQSRTDKTRGPEMAAFMDTLMVCSSESNESDKLDTAKVKALTGDTTISFRYNFSNKVIQFKAICGLFIDSNYKPYIPPRDTATWDRLRIFPFVCRVTEKDPTLKKKLIIEQPGIFNWLLEGLDMVLAEGEIFETEEMKEYKDGYKHEVDTVEQFVEDCLIKTESPADRIIRARLFDTYQGWCEDNHYNKSMKSKFFEELAKNIKCVKSGEYCFIQVKYSELGALYSKAKEWGPRKFAEQKRLLLDSPRNLPYESLREDYFSRTWAWFVENVRPNYKLYPDCDDRDLFFRYNEWCSQYGCVGLKWSDFKAKMKFFADMPTPSEGGSSRLDGDAYEEVKDLWGSLYS